MNVGGYPTKSDTSAASMPSVSQRQTAFDGVWQRIKPGTEKFGGEVDFEITVESNSDVVDGNGTATLDCELAHGTGIVTGSTIEATGTLKETNAKFIKENGEISNDGQTITWSNNVTWRRRTHTKSACAPSWTLVIVPDDADIKPRRGVPTLKVSEFCNLVSQHGVNAPSYITPSEGLNDWSGFAGQRLKLERVEYPSMRGPLTGHAYGTTKWDMEDANTLKDWCKNQKGITARLRTDDDAARGWASNSPGFAWWYTPGELRNSVAEFELQGRPVAAGQPRIAFGTDMLKVLDLEAKGQVTKATKAYYWAHRYCRPGKSNDIDLRNMVTYHVFVQLEWDNLPNTTTVCELAWRQGISAYKGQSNFFEDWGREEHAGTRTEMAKAIESHGSAMIMPWRPTLSEIRIIDIPKSASEFKKYMETYGTEDPTERGKRFVNVEVTEGTVRLSNRSRADLMKAILSYIGQDRTYSETTRNCQHFGADFFSYLTGKDVKPYSAISRAFVWNAPKQNLARFLYDPDLS
eukprot:gnl/MRDRNA2_/MRDRNA2_35109_c0_seq1.p1 gnl/MRDRNA2_/MRDRNA2_35109_c0~~gnl/MRDRNA2_/MRDRNA2_35109_c0_seq1.p1  ORF type:complete len:520 (-),score=67.69 gnl/MRDRNA2_/MRDRNA2_35109_c0_seq1:71-1630(-)